ncbi:MAG: hypothetical protein Q8O56_12985 [Solirubrobacteraceae bacterium]|nr:hypothetical protein [Solirubrobacteraceae bacterium]
MDLHQQQQFELLLAQAAESFIERIVQRCAGQENALRALRDDRNADGVWLDDFVDAVFADWCLDNAEGAAFVLCALQRRPLTIDASGTVGELLVHAAKSAFGELLHGKVLESMSRASVYG